MTSPLPANLDTVISYLLDADHDIYQALEWSKALTPEDLQHISPAAQVAPEWYQEMIGSLIAGLKLTAAALGLDPERVSEYEQKKIKTGDLED